MAAALLITLRETLEASLVVGIVLAFLQRSNEGRYARWVWGGVAAGVLGSLALAWVFQRVVGGFEGRVEELYEGVTMLIAAGLITWMVLWMSRQGKRMKGHLEGRVGGHIRDNRPLGIFFLVFVSVLREGIETVIFLQAAFLQSQTAYHQLGAVLGIVLAIGASWLLFKGLKAFSLRRFFAVSSLMLLLFAAGLFAHAIHEFAEAHVIPELVEHVWNLSAVLPDDGTVGSILKGLFGYNADPSLIEVIAYVLYVSVAAVAWRRMQKA